MPAQRRASGLQLAFDRAERNTIVPLTVSSLLGGQVPWWVVVTLAALASLRVIGQIWLKYILASRVIDAVVQGKNPELKDGGPILGAISVLCDPGKAGAPSAQQDATTAPPPGLPDPADPTTPASTPTQNDQLSQT